MSERELRYRTLGGRSSEDRRPEGDERAVDPCWICMAPTAYFKWEAPVCDGCQAVVREQLTQALPLLQKRLETLHKAEVEAFVAAGRLDGAKWRQGRLFEETYTPTDELVHAVAEDVAVAVAHDYRHTKGGIGLSLVSPNGRGGFYADGYWPYVDGDLPDEFSDALAAALKPHVREWLAAVLPGAIEAMDPQCVARTLLRHALGRDLDMGPVDDGFTMLQAAQVMHGCGLSDGAYALLRLNIVAVDPGDAEMWIDPFEHDDDPEDAWDLVAVELPEPARGYIARAREWQRER